MPHEVADMVKRLVGGSSGRHAQEDHTGQAYELLSGGPKF